MDWKNRSEIRNHAELWWGNLLVSDHLEDGGEWKITLI
jgi:hypothetical protein